MRRRDVLITSVVVGLAAFIGCVSEPDLSKLPGTYVTSDGKHVLVLRDDRTAQLRIDGHLPGKLGSPCDSPDVCSEGVCGPGLPSGPRDWATNVCQCPLGPDRRPLVAGCSADLTVLKPIPLLIETDPYGRVQLEIDASYPNVAGDFVCWSCRLDESGDHFECDHSHPKPGEILPKRCSFERLGAGGLPPTIDGGAPKGATVSCWNTVCSNGTACCWSSTQPYCSTSSRTCSRGGVPLSCTTPGDCASGEQCCATLDAEGQPKSAACSRGACGGTTLCTGTSDCAFDGGGTCQPLGSGVTLKACKR